jgi:hypothetical protein
VPRAIDYIENYNDNVNLILLESVVRAYEKFDKMARVRDLKSFNWGRLVPRIQKSTKQGGRKGAPPLRQRGPGVEATPKRCHGSKTKMHRERDRKHLRINGHSSVTLIRDGTGTRVRKCERSTETQEGEWHVKELERWL